MTTRKTRTKRPTAAASEAEERFLASIAEARRCVTQVAEELIGDYFACQSPEAKALLELMPSLAYPRLDDCVADIRAGATLPCECNEVYGKYLKKVVAAAQPIRNYQPRRDHIMRYRELLYEYTHLNHIATLWQSGNREAFVSLLGKFHQHVTRSGAAQTTLPTVSVADAADMPAPLFTNGPPPGGFGLIIGTDGVGKGWLTLDILLGCALARPMNIPRFQRAGEPLRTLYLSYEDDPSVLRVRLDALCAAAGVTPETWRAAEADGRINVATDLAPLFTQSGYNPAVTTDTFKALEKTIRDQNIKVCVIDPLGAAAALQNENDNSALAQITMALRHLARDTQCAVLISHHTSKARREAEEHHAARGGSALTGAARWVLRVIQNPGDISCLTVNIPKNSYGPALPAIPIQRRESGVLREISNDHLQAARETLLRDVLRFIRDNPDIEINPNAVRLNCSRGIKALCKAVKASHRQMAEMVQEAINRNLLTVEERRRKSSGRLYNVLVPTPEEDV